MKENSRSFTVVSSSLGPDGGRYIAEDPMVAGRKAGKKLFEKAEKLRKSSARNMVVDFEMREISQVKKVAYSKERYFYRVTRVLIPERERKTQKFSNGVEFTPIYTYKIKSVDKKNSTTDHRGGESSYFDGGYESSDSGASSFNNSYF